MILEMSASTETRINDLPGKKISIIRVFLKEFEMFSPALINIDSKEFTYPQHGGDKLLASKSTGSFGEVVENNSFQTCT